MKSFELHFLLPITVSLLPFFVVNMVNEGLVLNPSVDTC